MANVISTFDKATGSASWTRLIMRYVTNGEELLALETLAVMQAQGIEPNCRIFVAALRACTRLAVSQCAARQYAALEVGMRIHHQLAINGVDGNRFVVSTLINMYGKCGRLIDARLVFDRMPDRRNVVAWNAMILGYLHNRRERQALDLFGSMKARGCEPTTRTFVAALKACSRLAEQEFGRRMYEDGDLRLIKLHSLETGMTIHSYAQSSKLDTDIFVANSLVNMYGKCGSLVSSRLVLDRMPHRDVVSWTSMALCYAESDKNEELALQALSEMHREGCQPNALTFVAGLKACTNLAAREPWLEVQGQHLKLVNLERGMALHCKAWNRNFCSDAFVVSSLVDLYGKCGSIADACRVFVRTRCHLVPLTSLMLGLTENGEPEPALKLFQRAEPTIRDAQAFVAASKACKVMAETGETRNLDGKNVKVEALETCMAIHSEAFRSGADSSTYLTSSLIEAYASCGSLVDAVSTFNRRKFQDVFSWTALIIGYVKNGEAELGLQAFEVMQRSSGISPNAQCYAAALAACAKYQTFSEVARGIQCQIFRRGLEGDSSLNGMLKDLCF